jgi:hypothetical protein
MIEQFGHSGTEWILFDSNADYRGNGLTSRRASDDS